MSQMKTIVWSKLKSLKSPKSPFPKTVGCQAEGVKSNVNEEYMKVLRTDSYIDICSKVEGQLRRKTLEKSSASSSSPPSSFSQYAHLLERFLEPRQEVLTKIIQDSKLDLLLVDYFNASLEACNTCESLLRGLHQVRLDYSVIERAIKQAKRVGNGEDFNTDEQCEIIFGDLASFVLLKNPLSAIGPVQFHTMHDGQSLLLHRLASKCKKIKRKTKYIECCKKVVGCTQLIAYSALAIFLLVLAIPSLAAGIIAVPGLIACFFGLYKKKIKTSSLRRLGNQLDIAAKGVYILINDFDTMGRLVRRLHDEIEYYKAVAGMCVKNDKREVLKEVVREFWLQETSFLEQLEELEKHVYLCFLTINRSRRLLVQEILTV